MPTLQENPQALTGRKVNVLVVDDTPENLYALEALLTGADRTIIKAASGEDALKCLMDNDIGLVLLDVKMPGLDGYETAALIRQRDRTKGLPIIFLTAYHKDEQDVRRGYAVGAADYVCKPVVPAVLKAKVDRFIELAKQRDALKQANEDSHEAQAELDRRVEQRTKELTQANRLLEEKVVELERFHEVVVDRELKMVKLEEENKALRGKVEHLQGKVERLTGLLESRPRSP